MTQNNEKEIEINCEDNIMLRALRYSESLNKAGGK